MWEFSLHKKMEGEPVMTLKVGSIVYSTPQGLGILAKSFYDAGVVTHPLILEHHSRLNFGAQWYPGCQMIPTRNLEAYASTLQQYCESVDVMLFFETPFYWPLIDHCRKRGIKTILMPMYECLPPKSRLPYQPDKFICPSLLDLRYFDGDNSVFIPVPVTKDIQWHQRTVCQHFIHNAGHGGLKGRNGTAELMEAMQYVKSPITLTIRSQVTLKHECKDPRVKINYNHHPYSELFNEGDTFIFPESFNGLSLPLQEAYSAGMCVMATDRYPMNTWLPPTPLIPVEKYRRDSVGGPCVEFDRAVIEPRLIAETIDRMYGQDISSLSLSGKQWASEHSWDALKPAYLMALSN